MKTYDIAKNVNLRAIARSGQCFRLNEVRTPVKSYFNAIAQNKFARFIDYEDHYSITCEDHDYDFWINYLDFNANYSTYAKIIQASNDQFLKAALNFGKCLTILNQDFWETTISFIISQNNNIPRIKKIIEAICQKFGERIYFQDEIFYGFPSKETMTGVSLDDLKDLGLGYRDEYIYELCNSDFSNWKANRESLLKIRGIGPKVASCILLYGCHDMNEYPLDTWMKRIVDEVYGGDFDGKPFNGFLGYVQLLDFYYYRHLNGKLV